MSFEALVRDPKSYLSIHQCSVQQNSAAANACVASNPVPLAGGVYQSQLYTQSPNHFLTMIAQFGMSATKMASTRGDVFKAKIGVSSKIQRNFVPFVSGHDVGFRYLPFRVNACTYMQLDPAATFWLTGPLSGCTIGVIREGGAIWTFHSNDNIGNGQNARNRQQTSIQEVCTALGLTFANVQLCEYTQEYQGLGFVFGRLRGTAWKFYSHAHDTDTPATATTAKITGLGTRTRKWAEI